MPSRPLLFARTRRAVGLGFLAQLAFLLAQPALACTVPTPDEAARSIANRFYKAVHSEYAAPNPVVTPNPVECSTCWDVKFTDGDSAMIRVAKRLHASSPHWGEVVHYASPQAATGTLASARSTPLEQHEAEIRASRLLSMLQSDTSNIQLASTTFHTGQTEGARSTWTVTWRRTPPSPSVPDEFVRISVDATTGLAFAVENHLNSLLPGGKSCLIGQTAMWVFSVLALIGIAATLARRYFHSQERAKSVVVD